MRLEVRLTLGDPTHITVTGQTPAPLRPDPWHDVLRGREDLLHRLARYQGYGRPDGVHVSDDDGLPGKLAGPFSRYGWPPATLTHKAQAARPAGREPLHRGGFHAAGRDLAHRHPHGQPRGALGDVEYGGADHHL